MPGYEHAQYLFYLRLRLNTFPRRFVKKHIGQVSNSLDQDETPSNSVSHLGSSCLHVLPQSGYGSEPVRYCYFKPKMD